MAHSFRTYEERITPAAFYPDRGRNPLYPVLGLAGEVGEVAEKVKKIYRDRGGVFTDADRQAIKKELGDVLFYIAMMAQEMGGSLEDVAVLSVHKIEGRVARGTLGGSGDDR